jgi:hypothetical protein
VVSENIQKFKSFFQNHSNVELSITYTVTPLNVYYIDQDTDQLEKMFGLPVLHNFVTTPEYDIRHLPTEVKNYLTKKTKNSIVVEFLKQIIPGCDVEWPKFCKVTDKLDQLRNQDFKNKKFISVGFGVGLSWGSAAFNLNDCIICDLVEI